MVISCCVRHTPLWYYKQKYATCVIVWPVHSVNLIHLYFFGLQVYRFPNKHHRGRDRMVVRFTTTCAISTYHHYSCEFEPCSWWGVLDTTLGDKVCQWFSAGRWLSPGSPISSTNKSDRHDETEILLKVELNTITLTPHLYMDFYFSKILSSSDLIAYIYVDTVQKNIVLDHWNNSLRVDMSLHSDTLSRFWANG